MAANRKFLAEVSREQIESALGRRPLRVLEFGSYDGADGARYKTWWPKATVHSIEADPMLYSRILEHAKQDGIFIHHAAVCLENGVTEFYRNWNKDLGDVGLAGCVRRRSHRYLRNHPEQVYNGVITVPAVRLDTFLDYVGWDRADYVHIDVEGIEDEVIASLGDRRPTVMLVERCPDPWAHVDGPASRETQDASMRVAKSMGYEIVQDMSYDWLCRYA